MSRTIKFDQERGLIEVDTYEVREVEMHPHALTAVRAAEHWSQWGPFAARRFAQRRDCPAQLVRLARQLKAATKGGL